MKEEATEYFIMQKDKKAYTRFLTSNLSLSITLTAFYFFRAEHYLPKEKLLKKPLN